MDQFQCMIALFVGFDDRNNLFHKFLKKINVSTPGEPFCHFDPPKMLRGTLECEKLILEKTS